MLSSSVTGMFTRPGNKCFICFMYVSAWTSMGVTDLHHRLMVCSPCPQRDVNSTRSEGQSISSLHNSHEDGIRKLTQSRNLNLFSLIPANYSKRQDQSI